MQFLDFKIRFLGFKMGTGFGPLCDEEGACQTFYSAHLAS